MAPNEPNSFSSQDAQTGLKEAYGNQTLPVAVLPDDFDGIPLDGSQYLAIVRASADLLPTYFYAANPYAPTETEVSTEPLERSTLEEEDLIEDDIPSDDWRETFVERFCNMREAIRNTPTPTYNPNAPASKVNLPSTGDKNAWYHLIYRAKVSSLIDTTVTSVPIIDSASQTGASADSSLSPAQALKPHAEQQSSSSSLNDGQLQPHSSSAPQARFNQQSPRESSLDATGKAYRQMLDEETELYHQEQQSQVNPLKRKAVQDVSDAEAGIVSDIELAQKEERRRLKKALRNEPRTLRFPSPSLMRRFDSQTMLELVGYITEWIQTPNPTVTDAIPQSASTSASTTHASMSTSSSAPATAISDFLSLWVFSLLSELERDLLSDEISVLRDLARAVIEALKLWRLRQRLLRSMSKSRTKEEEDLAGVEARPFEDPETGAWMIIAIVVGVWGQTDLWQDARSALRRA